MPILQLVCNEEKRNIELGADVSKRQIDDYWLWLSKRSWQLRGLLLFVSIIYVLGLK